MRTRTPSQSWSMYASVCSSDMPVSITTWETVTRPPWRWASRNTRLSSDRRPKGFCTPNGARRSVATSSSAAYR